MEAIPDFVAFKPAGLTTYVGPDASARAVTRTRADIVGGKDGCAASGDILFALHTVDVRDSKPLPIPLDKACDEEAIREHIRDANAHEENLRAMEEAEGATKTRPPPGVCTAYLTGQTRTGWKVGFTVPFKPFFEVEVASASEDSPATRRAFEAFKPSLAWCLQIDAVHLDVHWHTACHFKGYIPDPADPLKRKTFLYARMAFPTIRLMEHAANIMHGGLYAPGSHGVTDRVKTKFPLYEDRIDTDQKFIDAFNLQPSGWHVVAKSDAAAAPPGLRQLLVNSEYALVSGRVIRAFEGVMASVPPMIIASVDGEMNGKVANRFPKAHRPDNAVVVIGVVFAIAGGSGGSTEGIEFERQAFVLGSSCDVIEGVIVRLFDDECELIAAVRDELFVRKYVDVVAGHNLVKFDMDYFATRILAANQVQSSRFMRFGALITEALELKKKGLTSAGMGSNTLSLLAGVGFAYVDTMLLCKQNHKLRENTLSFASKTFLDGDAGKFDMPYNLIPEIAAGTNAAHWRLLVAYCVQDCVLVVQLLKKWDSIKDLVAQSRVINIPMAVNVICGQQQRVRDSLMKKARTMNMVMNGVNEKKTDITVNVTAEGGWVLENVVGLHDKPVVVLDFASLYPSVQREHNLCWSTVVEDISEITDGHRAAGLEVQTYVTATGTYHIVKNVPGVFPLQLKDLLDARKQYKREMADAPYGSAAYQNGDAKQKATKIVMNSGYGTANCEEGKGIMPCKAVGTITCAEGRKLNQCADAFCKATFGTETLYGDTDSIMIYFPETELYARIAAEHGGREPTRKERLQHAMHMGHVAEAALNAMFDSDVIKTECEKVYFKFLSCGKKTYAGLKFEPGDVAAASDNLDPPNKAAGQSGGAIEAKGIRTVRRDVPLFCSAMTKEILFATFFSRSMDEVYHIVHKYTEGICHGKIPLDDFVITKEIKEGTSKVVQPHQAVSYAREHARPGSGYADGDRVPFVIVEEYDAQRMIRPSWLDSGAMPDNAVEAKVSDKECLDPKRSMYARHIDEIRDNPDANHIDIEYYVDLGIVSVLKQLFPEDVPAQREILLYAARAKQYYRGQRLRKSGILSTHFGEELGPSAPGPTPTLEEVHRLANLPLLSHKQPKAPVLIHGLTESEPAVSRPTLVKKKPAAKKKKVSQVDLSPFS